MIEVPKEFTKREASPYPLTSEIEFEYWFYQKYSQERPNTEYKYLPITWTEIHRFGTPDLKERLRQFIKTLPKERMFTICQHDDGIQFKLPKNVMVYASGNYNPEYYPIPLIYKTNDLRVQQKKIEFSFIGAKTHKVRNELVNYYPNNCFLERYNRNKFTYLIGSSQFSLCPRGYGASSFRIMEALMCKSIPVYISDDFIEPFNIPFETYGIKVNLEDVWKIPEIIKDIPLSKFWNNKDIALKFTYEGCYKTIIETLR